MPAGASRDKNALTLWGAIPKSPVAAPECRGLKGRNGGRNGHPPFFTSSMGVHILFSWGRIITARKKWTLTVLYFFDGCPYSLHRRTDQSVQRICSDGRQRQLQHRRAQRHQLPDFLYSAASDAVNAVPPGESPSTRENIRVFALGSSLGGNGKGDTDGLRSSLLTAARLESGHISLMTRPPHRMRRGSAIP